MTVVKASPGNSTPAASAPKSAASGAKTNQKLTQLFANPLKINKKLIPDPVEAIRANTTEDRVQDEVAVRSRQRAEAQPSNIVSGMMGAFGSGAGHVPVSLHENQNITNVLDTVAGVANTVTTVTNKVKDVAAKVSNVSTTVAGVANGLANSTRAQSPTAPLKKDKVITWV